MKAKVRFILFLLMSGAATRAQTTLNTSLTACYALDGTGAEPINNLTGTLSAVTTTIDKFSTPASALAFNGTASSYILLPNSPLLKANAISVSCWVKLNSNQTKQVLVYTHNGCGTFHEAYQLAYNKTGNFCQFEVTKSNFMCSPQGQTIISSTNTSIQAQTWYHVGFYAAADTMKLFVNGVQQAYTNIPQPLVYGPGAGVILGGNNNATNFPLSGVLDNVRFYNRKLLNTEMMQLYTQDPPCPFGLGPAASFTAPATVCKNQPITFTNQSGANATAYSWQIPGGIPATSTLTSPMVYFTTAGVRTVSLTAYNSFGPGNTFTQSITVNLCNFTEELGTNAYVQIYPNPTHDRFTIEPATSKPVTFAIFNMLGMKVLEVSSANGETLQIDLGDQPAGVYLLRCKELDLARKVVLERK